ncbi:MAG: 4Fe-4S dicluster domain-containing protein [Anaerolineae bacterium]|nr:4Fe-4S dicluster domain-containing protein [Anaerolineae bacterium]
MGLKIMQKAAFPGWVNRLCASCRVVGPKPLHGQYVFDDIGAAEELAIDYSTSVLPPKKYILPQREELLYFKGDQIEAVIEEASQPTVIMGVHTCDMHAIHFLDRVYEQGYTDQHYLARRENTILVSIECLRPCTESSFCKDMGTLSITEGFDLHLTDLGDEYAVDIGSEKGEALLDNLEEVSDPTSEDYQRVNRVIAEKWPRFHYKLDFDVTELPSLLTASANSDYWGELGDRCLACAMCTNVCPTCYCFNIVDEVDFSLNAGQRTRQWDSCQLDEFATVAGGHNFRETRAARQRHRFFRKGKYQWEAHGLIGCVGCGRCAEACLVHITPVDTFNQLNLRRRKATAEVK